MRTPQKESAQTARRQGTTAFSSLCRHQLRRRSFQSRRFPEVFPLEPLCTVPLGSRSPALIKRAVLHSLGTDAPRRPDPNRTTLSRHRLAVPIMGILTIGATPRGEDPGQPRTNPGCVFPRPIRTKRTLEILDAVLRRRLPATLRLRVITRSSTSRRGRRLRGATALEALPPRALPAPAIR